MPDPAVADVSPLPAVGPGKVVTGAVFTIGELRAIRFYEDCGLLTPQRQGRNRVYTARDRTRLKLTLRGKRLGLTLAEVKDLVDMYESPRDTVPQLHRYLEVLGAHRAQLEQQMTDNPQDIVVADVTQLRRIGKLVKGVKVDQPRS